MSETVFTPEQQQIYEKVIKFAHRYMPKIMEQLSLFQRFTVFVNGVFDLTAVVYYLSVAGFFLLLSVQSLEKRRYN